MKQMMMKINKVSILCLIIFVSACSNTKRNNFDESSLVLKYLDDSLNEIKTQWKLSKINEWNAHISSPAFDLDNNKSTCVIRTIVLKRDSDGNFLPIYEQMIMNPSFFEYALKEDKYKNCEDIEKNNYFTILDLKESDERNYGLFNIAELVSNKQWLKDEKNTSYSNQIAKNCTRLESDLSISSVIERGFTHNEELYLVKLNCNIEDESHYIELNIHYDAENKKYDYWIVNTVKQLH